MRHRMTRWGALALVIIAGPSCGNILGLDDYHPVILCSDGIQDGAESDVDCGGKTCGKCAGGKKCDLNADCMSGSCTRSVCTP